MLYEDDAEEWALYLRELFLPAVDREGILMCPLGTCSPQDLQRLGLSSYKCKLLIVSDILLQDLTPQRCQFLAGVLVPPESVVTLLCGTNSSDRLYQAMGISQGYWELTTEQEPEDYVHMVESLVLQDYKDHFEVYVPTKPPQECSGGRRESKGTEALSKVCSGPCSVLVLPSEVLCENPGEIFIILRDENMHSTVEVEFRSATTCIRICPAPWSKTVWRTKALDFPAGPIGVDVYCDEVLKATAEIRYHAGASVGTVGPRDGDGDWRTQTDMEELDETLAFVFKHEIPHYAFQQCHRSHLLGQRAHLREVPTLLHCAAKFGLKHLCLHLLGCLGAGWASSVRNSAGRDPAGLAEQHGHQELQRIFKDFATKEASINNGQEDNDEEDAASVQAHSPATDLQWDHSFTHRPGADDAAMAGTEEVVEPEHCLQAASTGSLGEQYENVYAYITGDNLDTPTEPPPLSRPPLPPPRPTEGAARLEHAPCTLQVGNVLESQMEPSQHWYDPGSRQEEGSEAGAEEEEEAEGQEDPYAFTEIQDSEYDTVLACSRSTKKKTRSRSFIVNRPPAPAPRPPMSPLREETTPYIAQVFQQKAARRQSDGDKFHTKKQDRAQDGSHMPAVGKGWLDAGQEELIILQERVRNRELSMDTALELFRQWQLGQDDLEAKQQEKLRQLRDCIIGKRPEDENIHDHLTIVHHPNSSESVYNENKLLNISLSNKPPARVQVEKEFGFCCKKDH